MGEARQLGPAGFAADAELEAPPGLPAPGSAARRVPRDPLPLPVPPPEEVVGGLSRGCQQRAGRRAALRADVRRAVQSVNRLYCHVGALPRHARRAKPAAEQLEADELEGPAQGARSLVQRQMLESIEAAVEAAGAPPPGLSPAEALRKLRVASWYDVSAAKLASYSPARVSWPAEGCQPVGLSELWGHGGSRAVEDFLSTKVLAPEQAARQLEGCGVRSAYSDPLLRRKGAYEEFVRSLHARNLVDFDMSVKEKVEAFFVMKKDNLHHRLIFDCRRSNCWFGSPDSVSL